MITVAPDSDVRVPWWVTGLDVLACALVLLAGWTFTTGGPVFWIGEHKISATSGVRVAAWAALALVIRHAAFRRPRLDARLAQVFVKWAASVGAGTVTALAPTHVRPRSRFEIPAVTGLMIALTLILTYPQVRGLDRVNDLGDPLFSVWRLAWFAHQLPRDPLHLFDTNMFWPVRDTLAFSDSTVLPGLLGAPFIWLGLAPLTVHSLMLMASFVLAGVCMYLFVRAATGQGGAAIVAGVAFAFYPFRMGQYTHLEQLFSFWIPLALWAFHRTLTRGRLVDGLLTGAAIAAQFISGMHLGAFFVVWLVPVGAVLAVGTGRVRAAIKPLAAGAVVAAVLIAPVAVPHLHARALVGERGINEVHDFSGEPSDYLVARGDSYVYRSTWFGRQAHHFGERDLFPGLLVLALGAAALARRVRVPCLAYVAGLIVAFDASLGTNGFVFPLLYNTLVPFRAFRAPTRFAMFVSLSLVLLAGYGFARLNGRIRRRWVRACLTAALVAGLALEAFLVRTFPRAPYHPPAIYRWLQEQPRGVIAQLPASEGGKDPAYPEAAYLYFSTFHWLPTVNGYSGAFPTPYMLFRNAMERFPDGDSLRVLRTSGVDYLVLQEERYAPGRYRAIVDALDQRPLDGLEELVRMRSAGYEARVFRVVK